MKAVILLFFFAITLMISGAEAQSNRLHFRIDTVTVKPTDGEAFVNVYSKVYGNEPHNIYAYSLWVTYDTNQIRKVGVFLPAKVSDYHPQVGESKGELRVVVLGQPGVELIDSVMYTIRFSLRNVKDTAHIRFSNIDFIDSNKSIGDTTWEDGWVRLEKPPEPPKKISLTVSTGDSSVASDSILSVPVYISNVNGGKISSASLFFRLDTSLFTFVNAVPGNVAGASAEVTSGTTDGKTKVTVTSPTDFQDSGVFAIVHLKAKYRIDTACTTLKDSSFAVENTNALVDSVILTAGDICVLGKDTTTPLNVVFSTAESGLTVYPNPFTSEVFFEDKSAVKMEVEIFDLLGRRFSHLEGNSSILHWQLPQGFKSGVYLVQLNVTTPRGEYQTRREIIKMQ